MRSPPCPLVSLRTPACPGFGVFGDRKSSCFDRSGWLGRVAGKWGVIGRSGDAGLERLYSANRDAGAGSGSFERVQMGALGRVREIRLSDGLLGDGSYRSDKGSLSGLGSFERVQIGTAAGENPALGGSFGAAAAAPFERVQMSLLGGSVDGDDIDSRRCAMQLRK